MLNYFLNNSYLWKAHNTIHNSRIFPLSYSNSRYVKLPLIFEEYWHWSMESSILNTSVNPRVLYKSNIKRSWTLSPARHSPSPSPTPPGPNYLLIFNGQFADGRFIIAPKGTRQQIPNWIILFWSHLFIFNFSISLYTGCVIAKGPAEKEGVVSSGVYSTHCGRMIE